MSLAGRAYRHRDLDTENESQYAVRPHGGVVTSSNPEKDTMTYTAATGGRTMPVSHPYLGPNSWIRIMPERRTGIILNSRSETGETYTAAYVTEGKAKDLIEATYATDPRFYYRKLQESEVEIMSKGLASAHFGRTGTLSLRGGPITQTFDVENLELDVSSPTFRYRTLGNTFGFVSDEIRFGMVKRLIAEEDTSPRWVQVQDSEGSPIYAKEYTRHIGSPNAAVPNLIDHREGDVIADDGTEISSPVTGKKLRSRTIYGTVSSEESSLEVDVDGNMGMYLPEHARHGLDINISQSDLRLTIGKDEIHSVSRNTLLESGSHMELESPEIKLGRNADTPVVRGGDLATWVVEATVQTAMGPANFSIVTQDAILDTFSNKVLVE